VTNCLSHGMAYPTHKPGEIMSAHTRTTTLCLYHSPGCWMYSSYSTAPWKGVHPCSHRAATVPPWSPTGPPTWTATML